MKKLLIFSLLIFLSGCQQIALKSENAESAAEARPVRLGKLKPQLTKVLLEAENKATPEGRRVLEAGREMALIERAVIRGSCWDYANAVFNRAGYPLRSSHREVVADAKRGTPLDIDFKSIQPGDFLSYINHSYNGIAHSAIFVDWLDYDNKIALMLSYAGQKRHEPARYKPYDLSDVFYVARARG